MTRFVVTGTDTGIGKTIFSASLARATGTPYWKPVQSGLEEETDSEIVARLAGVPVRPEAYRLVTPASPHIAAEIDGVAIDIERLTPPPGELIVEGAGGALVPVTRRTLYAELFARWQVPVIVCARTSLGTINHSLLTIEALKRRDVPIHGVVFIGDAVEDSEAIIADVSGVRRLGRLPVVAPLTSENLAAAFGANFDIADFR
ncbi:dethiobiotin synthase [Sphingopyxis alaskensis]|jgi:dethiobiotin synthetase|uniref:ATP-dependent dethiobiotin synthetase BioD n=1 Tax=Sphingopyxis alaskensis (strain DSM 13593 / LMG 18877 / RB2256) TaxID=317655 RepID=BIOD_SPHAL|nr:dethiobiotin synthase [Sphingopyxis alaskensis]Q1GT35.1 RecName: Full=ATP-dependent dethiobiotin synthetase BioD; AltName: Full=DTB synthetase; Short=DTBS; AltName: Full=Dethiobiotin synthase [Sphingopyxis alaskensis RB2256]ABF53187.1 dethiobiotin synthase [Sphingopyxis alaskensis RB2256]MCM3418606.1 dethiobiotin synthase [Sphingopyxis alaskensis]